MKAKWYIIGLWCVVLGGGPLFAISYEQTSYSFWCGADPGTPVSATAWYDDKICVMIEAETPADRNATAMADFVDFLHRLHDEFQSQTGLTNLPLASGWNGRIVIQIPLTNCGAGGLGNHGSLGISVGVALFETQYDLCLANANRYHQVWFYETNRNYWDPDWNQKIVWAVNNDPAQYGWWTVGMNNAQAVMMCHRLGCDLIYGSDIDRVEFEENLLEVLRGYFEGGYTWDSGMILGTLPWWPTEKTLNEFDSGLLIYGFNNWGGFDFLNRWYTWIQSTEIPNIGGYLDYVTIRDNIYKIWSMAAQRDLRNYFENALKWPITEDAKTWVAARVSVGAAEAAILPQPIDGGQAVNEMHLSWDGHFDADSHSVYFGTDATPDSSEFKGTQTATAFDPDTLAANTTYYWRIDSTNSSGTVTGDVWSFTTGADISGETESVGDLGYGCINDSALTSGDGFLMYSEESVHIRFTQLPSAQADHFVTVRCKNKGFDAVEWEYCYGDTWSNGGWVVFTPRSSDVLVAEVEFETDTHVSLEGAPYEIYRGIVKGYASGDLTIYNMQWNGNWSNGDWEITGISFVRHSGQATWFPDWARNPRPVPGTTVDPVSGVELSWLSGSYATSHDVYFGMEPDLDSGDFKGNQTSLTYDSGTLDYGTTYYWRVDEVNADGITEGVSWKLITEDIPVSSGLIGYERFDYSNGQDVLGQIGGLGWADDWQHVQGSVGTHTITSGLSYTGLTSVGNALSYTVDDSSDSNLVIKRNLSQKIGVSAGTMWGGMLIKGSDIGSGHLFLQIGNNSAVMIGKAWGVNFSINNTGSGVQMLTDTLYWLVWRYDFYENNGMKVDTYLWVNPDASMEPSTSSAIASRSGDSWAASSQVSLNIGRAGSQSYVIDELRLTGTYDDLKDVDPPKPDIASFSTVPYAVDSDSIAMVGSNSTDETGPVEYYFTCLTGGGHDSGWQTSKSYTDAGLSPDTTYTYMVQMRDALGNVNLPSNAHTATTTSSSSGGGDTVYIAPINSGVAAGDGSTGSGYLMYSEQSVHVRFTSPAVHQDQGDHLVVVRYNGGWEYDYNASVSGWAPFTPASGDVLLAALNFDTDIPASLEGVNDTENGITKGYASGDLAYFGDQWNGMPNEGEWDVTGTYFVPNQNTVKVNFQSAGSPTVSGYLEDNGNVYGDRGNGQTYGWNTDHSDQVRDRNAISDQLLDTLCHFEAGGTWQLSVPNGSYDVKVSIGDPSFASTYTINVEGVNYWNNLGLSKNQFETQTQTVTISDGKLTIDQGSASHKKTRINYIEIIHN